MSPIRTIAFLASAFSNTPKGSCLSSEIGVVILVRNTISPFAPSSLQRTSGLFPLEFQSSKACSLIFPRNTIIVYNFRWRIVCTHCIRIYEPDYRYSFELDRVGGASPSPSGRNNPFGLDTGPRPRTSRTSIRSIDTARRIPLSSFQRMEDSIRPIVAALLALLARLFERRQSRVRSTALRQRFENFSAISRSFGTRLQVRNVDNTDLQSPFHFLSCSSNSGEGRGGGRKGRNKITPTESRSEDWG